MFSQQQFFTRLADEPLVFRFLLPTAYANLEPGAEPEVVRFYLYRYQTEAAKAAFEQWHTLPEAHKGDTAALSQTIRTAVCELMMREPEGLVDFPSPKKDKRPLAQRAMQYFTVPEKEHSDLLQQFWDTICVFIWNAHKEAATPKIYDLLPFERPAKGDAVNV